MNRTEAIIGAAKRSISRANILLNIDNAEAPILPSSSGNYLMRIFLGTPPSEQFVTIDTGSTECWVQCEPCENCYRQATPIFDLMKSSTYSGLQCSSAPCRYLNTAYCNGTECRYFVDYEDGTFSKGEFGMDVLTFGSDSSNMVNTSSFVFGCGHNNSWLPSAPIQNGTGMVGLGASTLSLVKQVPNSNIFSYCLTPPTSSSSGKLRFGSESTQSGKTVSTDMIIHADTLYYVNLEGISVDDERVEAKNSTEGNMIVDCGTALTYLESSLYYGVQNLLMDNIQAEPIDSPGPPFKVCYASLANVDVPTVTFHFSGGEDLVFDENNFFEFFSNGNACLTLIPGKGAISILGSISQVDYKVEFDFGRNTISFGSMDCSEA